jgi:hypothetical protein
MREILNTQLFTFPYTDLHFPGMNTGEKILFVTRESQKMVRLRLVGLVIVMAVLFLLSQLLLSLVRSFFPGITLFQIIPFVVFGIGCFGGYWWITETFRKSVFIITTRRLTKIIYTTPFTWYQFSLGLDEIADTGSYSSSYLEALLGLGYFVARSGAAAIKNFKIENIEYSADLHNYVNKLLYAFKHHPDKVDTFRPFVPFVKGERRKEMMKNFPEYKTEF